MGKQYKKKYPKYFKEFKCIGGSCTDSCCIGWDIDIDKVTFKQYYKVQDSEMKRMFQKNVHNNEDCTSPDVDYGKVKLKGKKRCPFLDDENYCIIYSKLGEEYLSNVCTCFPRIINRVDGVYETSLDVSCPEAARMILSKEEGIEFEECEEALGKHIISSEVDTNAKEFNNSPIKYFKEIRDYSIKIIQNRKYDLSKRLYILGDFINCLEETNDTKKILKIIENYNMDNVVEEYEKNTMNYIIQIDLFKKMLGFLDVFKETDSEIFKQHTRDIIKGFKFEEDFNLGKNAELYIKGYEDCIEEVINKNSYIFENYLVNFMYNYMFPFSETDSMFDGYLMLLIRYSFIKFYLVGKYLNDQEENIIEFIQVFSKVIGHHKTYLIDSLDYIKENEFDNVEFTKTLL